MRLRYLVILAASLTFGLAAHADTIRTFNIDDEEATPFANGTVGLDENTGQFVSGNFTIYGGPYPAAITTAPESQTFDAASGVTNVTYGYHYLDPGSTHDHGSGYDVFFIMALPTADLRGYTGGPLCSSVMICPGIYPVSAAQYVGYTYGPMDDNPGYYENDTLRSGLLTPVAATPEPSSLFLLFTGLIGVGALARERSKRIARGALASTV